MWPHLAWLRGCQHPEGHIAPLLEQEATVQAGQGLGSSHPREPCPSGRPRAQAAGPEPDAVLAELQEHRAQGDSPAGAAWPWALALLVLVGMQVKLRTAPRRLATKATKGGH